MSRENLELQKLPLARLKNDAKALPNGDALTKIIQVIGTSPEVALYFADNYKNQLLNHKKDKDLAPLVNEVDKYVKSIQRNSPGSESAWNADTTGVKTLNQNYQASVAKDVDVSALQDKKLVFGYLIDADSRYLGAFVKDNQLLDEKDSHSMNVLFTAWLTSHQKQKDDKGFIFEEKETGVLQRDARGNPIKADPAELRALITDEKHGFARYMQEQKNLSVLAHHFSDADLQQLSRMGQEKPAVEEPSASPSSSRQGS